MGFPIRVIENSLGQFIVVGAHRDTVYQAYVAKFNRVGELIWMKHYKPDIGEFQATDMKLSKNGEAYILGAYWKSWSDSEKIILMKIDTSGNIIWTHALERDKRFIAWSMFVSEPNRVYISGGSGLTFSTADPQVACFDFDGNLIWNKRYDFGTGSGAAIQKKEDKNYLINLGSAGKTLFIQKLDTNGNELWFKNYLSYGCGLSPISFYLNDDGSIMGVGDICYDNPWYAGCDPMIFKADSNGNLLWIKIIKGEWYVAEAFQIYHWWDGNYILQLEPEGLNTYYPNNHMGSDYLLAEMNGNGELLWQKIYDLDDMATIHFNLNVTRDSGLIGVAGIQNPPQQDKTLLIKTDKFGNTGCHDSIFNCYMTDTSFVQYTAMSSVSSSSIESDIPFTVTDVTSTVTVLCEDTAFISSSNITTTESSDENEFASHLFPNPFHDFGFIQINGATLKNNAVVNIIDLFGRRVGQFELNRFGKAEISRNDLPAGIYFYEVVESNEKIAAGKFIIQ